MKPAHPLLQVATLAGLGALVSAGPVAAQADVGYAIEEAAVIDNCSRCHRVDDRGRLSRLSYLRKTPEGWQTSIRRMVALHDVNLSPEDARAIVRYLANEQGLAPEELRPALFEVERRLIDHDYEGDSDVEFTCIQCHSMGRVMTQRRTEEEWALLLTTHRALYPLVDFQAFRRPGPAPEEGDRRHPQDVAVDHLSEAFPLETPEWSAWAATKRSPRLAGTWALSGYQAGRGALFGTVTITADSSDPDAFSTSVSYRYAETGTAVTQRGEGLVYTGYQWRGRSGAGTANELREVLFVERDQQTIHGRWFQGAYDEFGPDVTLTRVSGPIVSGVYPHAVRQGASGNAAIYGAGFGAATAADLDFGAGVTVTAVERVSGDQLTIGLSVAPAARVGARDLLAFGRVVEDALVVHDGIDRIEVTPQAGMARTGGGNFPKGHQVFDAIGFDDGPDGQAGTDDDLDLGRVPVTWRMEEYAAIYGDDDIEYVGSIRPDGTVDPALDGPNPNRPGMRNNIGDVWVVATHQPEGRPVLTARAHLIVTVPLYMRFEPWRPVDAPQVGFGTR